MRATRGLLASLGASTSLVLATAVVLFSVSTIVAFRGWPGIDGSTASLGGERIAVYDAAPGGGPTVTRAQRVVVPRTPASSPAPPRRVTTASRAQTATRTTSGPIAAKRPRSTARRRASSPATSPAPDPPAATVRPNRSVPPAGDPVRDVGNNLGGAAAGVAGGLGDLVQPTSPALGRTLDQAGRSVDQTIRGVTGAVGTLLDKLLGAPQPL